MDIKGAFDTISWKKILERLISLNCNGNLHNLIGSFLNDRKVTYGDIEHAVTCGVPQGSSMGPILWLTVADQILSEDKTNTWWHLQMTFLF